MTESRKRKCSDTLVITDPCARSGTSPQRANEERGSPPGSPPSSPPGSPPVHLLVHLLVHLSVHLLHTLMMARPVLTRSILRAHQSPHLCCGSIIDDYRSDEADDLEPEEEGDANSENSRQDDDDQPLYSGCNVSSAQFDALLFAYFIKH